MGWLKQKQWLISSRIYGLAKTMASRTAVEHFCHKLLSGHYTHIQRIANEYKDKFSCIDMNPLTAKEDFESTFQSICRHVFALKQTNVGCSDVLAVLGFALYTDKQLKDYSWYNQDILIRSLTNSLLEVNFKPYRLVGTTHTTCILF